jgi:hypothetical protein
VSISHPEHTSFPQSPDRPSRLPPAGTIVSGIRKALLVTLALGGSIATLAYVIDRSATTQKSNELQAKLARGRPDITELFPASELEMLIADHLNVDVGQVQIAPEVSWADIENRGITFAAEDTGLIRIYCRNDGKKNGILFESASPILRSQNIGDVRITHVLPSLVRISYAGNHTDHQHDDMVIQHSTLHGATFQDDTDGDGIASDVVSARSTFAVISPNGEVKRVSGETSAMSEEHAIIDTPLAWQRSLPLPRFVTQAKK